MPRDETRLHDAATAPPEPVAPPEPLVPSRRPRSNRLDQGPLVRALATRPHEFEEHPGYCANGQTLLTHKPSHHQFYQTAPNAPWVVISTQCGCVSLGFVDNDAISRAVTAWRKGEPVDQPPAPTAWQQLKAVFGG